ncbi:MAG: hypothetical protein IPK50_17070 [Fibrobacterota bacterium]|nr:MAG: hypothetical protein IPK50_17070 [Fibrobacterota bacterium]
MVLVFKGLKDYREYLSKNQIHILVLDCSMVTNDDLLALYDSLIFPMGGAYCSGDQTVYISDCIGELVAIKSFPTGEFSGFDLRWSPEEGGMMRNLWDAKFSSFLTGEYDVVVMTTDDRFRDEHWVAEELKRIEETDCS